MSFKGLAFIRQWAKEHIYKPRILGEPERSVPALVNRFRKDASAAQVELEDVEEEVGSVEKGVEDALQGRPLEEPKSPSATNSDVSPATANPPER
ncbi:MAG TPA: hypothetical protein VGX71_11595 [Pseudaminobacter sp.]|nr:hypothetical protein [Pseudaminobacter sp.]